MGDDEAKVLEQAKKLPFSERLVFTNWKARVSAYEDVSKIAASAYDASNPALKDFGTEAFAVFASASVDLAHRFSFRCFATHVVTASHPLL